MRKVLITVLIMMSGSLLAATPATVTLEVSNMTCSVCPITVKKALEQVDGVTEVVFDLKTKTAVVSYDSDKSSPIALTEATTNAGFPSIIKAPE
jgi:mercuric ion binding protein